jgi:redox-sensitive bicupin YhaK (pirin superfamily)
MNSNYVQERRAPSGLDSASIQLRTAGERGHAKFNWLDSRHTFSFGHYYDERYTGFRDLLVINEDCVVPGGGFPAHGHRDMEIISYILEGALEHKDSIGNGSAIWPGEVQRMSAGTSIRHSEYNHSQAELVHFLQIWIHLRRERACRPAMSKGRCAPSSNGPQLDLIGSHDGRDESVTIHQDVNLHRLGFPRVRH